MMLFGVKILIAPLAVVKSLLSFFSSDSRGVGVLVLPVTFRVDSPAILLVSFFLPVRGRLLCRGPVLLRKFGSLTSELLPRRCQKAV